MTLRKITRREALGWIAVTPALSALLARSGQAGSSGGVSGHHEDRVIIVLRLMGGNDGLNAVIPVRDDRYYRARPGIAIARAEAIALDGADQGLHPALREFNELMQAGDAGIVQAVGYPKSSRSHTRATEIWETGSVAAEAPAAGWLGAWLDDHCDCGHDAVGGVQFGTSWGRTLASKAGHARLIGYPQRLQDMSVGTLRRQSRSGPANPQFAALSRSQRELADAASLMQRAARGQGRKYAYPDTPFGQALQWTGDMIETGCDVRVFHVSVGSFATGAASFDTHIDQREKHELLFAQLGQGLHALTRHLRSAGQFDRTLVLSYSDFGRALQENRTRGTEHGDAGLMFYAGGAVKPGLQGAPADLGNVSPTGGVPYGVDFRSVYADVLGNWLGAATALPDGVQPFGITKT